MGFTPCDRVGSHLEDPTVVVVSYSGKEINAKLVYYGAGLSGKTTNLESIYEAVPETSRGKMVSMKTQSDRTLFFDLLPLDLGEIMGFKTRFLLYTVPGQVFYNATRKLVLKGADAIVFVADSAVGKMDENKESLANLRANLAEYGLKLDEIPWALQYNKRDLPNVYSVEELNASLNPTGKVPTFEAVATQGTGVFETFRGISHLLMQKVTRELQRNTPGVSRVIRPEETERLNELRNRANAAASEPPKVKRGDSGSLSIPFQPALGSQADAGARGGPDGGKSKEFSFGDERPLPKREAETAPATGNAAEAFPAGDDLVFDQDGGARRRRVAPIGGPPTTATTERAPVPGQRFEERTLALDEQETKSSPAASAPPAPAAASSSPAASNSAASRREVVVPVTIPAGTTGEIVLRITIKTTP
jgi:signal recognition particle receptor subunit beta